jgi:hypothetical protein
MLQALSQAPFQTLQMSNSLVTLAAMELVMMSQIKKSATNASNVASMHVSNIALF